MDVHITNNIQEKRKEKDLSRPELAGMVGVNWETIKAYEVKGVVPSLPVAFKLSVALETPLSDLFSAEIIEQMNKQEEDQDLSL